MKTQRLFIRVDANTKAKLKQRARHGKQTLSAFIRDLVNHALVV